MDTQRMRGWLKRSNESVIRSERIRKRRKRLRRPAGARRGRGSPKACDAMFQWITVVGESSKWAVPEIASPSCSIFMAKSMTGGQRPERLGLALQQVRKTLERPVGGRGLSLLARRRLTIRIRHLMSRVLIVVTVETQQLPIAPVGGIVVVIVILVMDRELAQLFATKFTAAPRTHPGIHLERLRPIGLLPLIPVAMGLGNNLSLPVHICWCLLR